jgi:HEAT repeat protein
MTDLDPAREIEEYSAAYRRLPDAEFLATVDALPALPDGTSREWDRDEPWRLAYRYLALTDVAAERRLRAAVVPLLERACYGDPGEMMRGLRHAFEDIAKPDWAFLAEAYSTAARSARPGARLWSVEGLGVLSDPGTLPVVAAALADPAWEVRRAACRAMARICHDHPSLRDEGLRALQPYASDPAISQDAAWACRRILGQK